MADWIKNLFIPLIEIIFIFGIGGYILYVVIKASHNAWSKSVKFFLKYTIMRKNYPEETLAWCIECMSKGFGYYDAKKLMLISAVPTKKINETLWIFRKVWNADNNTNNQKGGIKNNGRNIKGSYRENKAEKKLPDTSSSFSPVK